MPGTCLTSLRSNREKIHKFTELAEGLFGTVLQRGFYGEVGLKLLIQDGVIQEIREEKKRIER